MVEQSEYWMEALLTAARLPLDQRELIGRLYKLRSWTDIGRSVETGTIIGCCISQEDHSLQLALSNIGGMSGGSIHWNARVGWTTELKNLVGFELYRSPEWHRHERGWLFNFNTAFRRYFEVMKENNGLPGEVEFLEDHLKLGDIKRNLDADTPTIFDEVPLEFRRLMTGLIAEIGLFSYEELIDECSKSKIPSSFTEVLAKVEVIQKRRKSFLLACLGRIQNSIDHLETNDKKIVMHFASPCLDSNERQSRWEAARAKFGLTGKQIQGVLGKTRKAFREVLFHLVKQRFGTALHSTGNPKCERAIVVEPAWHVIQSCKKLEHVSWFNVRPIHLMLGRRKTDLGLRQESGRSGYDVQCSFKVPYCWQDVRIRTSNVKETMEQITSLFPGKI